ncbi:DNA mismatch repair endonuclease MutL [Bacillus sp. HMF5848]|uniref:DNA mismatch repair endonuclease MutL n=1 Tax=Bacillus sp. HMF5848 TaxID=2495421 RepID=UPI000F7B6AA6|nr:DNA mismatch repair endonuclease MutL [Bacillus sp. HMF5848]RSK27110.1 DNA mismatch repair endonuclease MutL [Bacillus sp. HMF5848]
MGKIIQLDDQLSNKIAAGEVVERPASVIKELVENSIDANSTIIEVEVEEAGLQRIRILDNGNGIESDDCEIAFSRHATSKIKAESDLFRIRTLGFRGEALPSIASVSKVALRTSTGSEAGTFIELEGGVIKKHERTNSRKGTDLTVEQLFFNTPARLKYMKTIHTELGHISDVMNRLALAHPHVSFKLMHNGKRMLFTPGNGDVRQVLASIYGVATAKKMLPIHHESLDFKISGHIALPEITRASRNYISTVINGRFVRHYGIMKAIEQGYHTLLPIGRHPIVMLKIEMDPILVDVNVHPAKLEVRLSKEQELLEIIESSIKQVFKKQTLIPEVETKAHNKREQIKTEQEFFRFEHVVKSEPEKSEASDIYIDSNSGRSDSEINERGGMDSTQDETTIRNEVSSSEIKKIIQNDSSVEEESIATSNTINDRLPPLYPIGQMHGTYILAQNENGLYIIDQHAAQERLKYEFYRGKVAEVDSALQQLLVPLTFDFASNEAIKLIEHKDKLEACGIFLESFGTHSFIVREHPSWFPAGHEQSVIEDLIQQVLTTKTADIGKLREEAAILMSCKASIKANHYLRQDEMFALLEDLRKSEDPFTCPHGRPILLHFSTYEMEKMFKRVM